MSQPVVYVNGQKAGHWAYGYNSFYLDITPFLMVGKPVCLAVRLDNLPYSSRWYPGAGLYRPVYVVVTNETAIDTWGTYLTTPEVTDSWAKVRLRTTIHQPLEGLTLVTDIRNPEGFVIRTIRTNQLIGNEFDQLFDIRDPECWSPDTPALYMAESRLLKEMKL
jgi:beta-galactosidase